MIGGVLALLQTFFDIVRLRKGPDAIPYSPVVFAITLLLWAVAGLPAYAVIEPFEISEMPVNTLISFVGAGIYAAVAAGFNKRPRTLQMLTAIFGAATILELLIFVVYAALNVVTDAQTALILATLVALWSVAVDGHIVARTIDKEFFVGFLIALFVFGMQIKLGSMLNPAEPGTL